MIDRKALLADLRKQVTFLEQDLCARVREDEAIHARLYGEWQKAREAGRTAATFESRRDEWVTQAALAWVLGTVFLRFCEDNGLIQQPYLAGPGDRLALALERQADYFGANPDGTDRDWILAGFAEMARTPAAAALFDKAHNPLWWLEISHDAAAALVAFWRHCDDQGEVVHDFTDPDWDTHFLGDLYQDLSANARQRYAFLKTPEFVEECILDLTLEPAVQEFGLERLRLIDPVCGSGSFLLGAFRRLLRKWRSAEPDTDTWELIRRSLASVHGADRSPFAVAMARFRLLIAVMREGGIRELHGLPDLPIRVATADSLLDERGADQQQMTLLGIPEDPPEIPEDPLEDELLRAGSYHVVVGNPPYGTPKDKAEAARYQKLYPVAAGAFSLTVPFTVRFFELARPASDDGRAAGYVGVLMANAFMKREFGRKLIEDFFPTVDLTHVIDTSGAYIPGHGSPTVILAGRRRRPGLTTFVVFGKRGEPQIPRSPARGLVWQSIIQRLRGSTEADPWTASGELPASAFHGSPWRLGPPDVTKLLDAMDTGRSLRERVVRIGYVGNTGADDLFTAPQASWWRAQVEQQPLVDVLTGSEVRDWQAVAERQGFLPLSSIDDERKWVPISEFPRHLRRLWSFRTSLRERRNFTGGSYREGGRDWYEWHHVTRRSRTHPWLIVFSWVATHMHFVLLRDHSVVPLNSAPVIELPQEATELDLIQLTAVLNSSAVCFWLKQHSQSKGQPRVGQTGTGEPWTEFYEFTSTRLGDLPLPPDRWSGDRWSVHARRLDELAQEMKANAPASVIEAEGLPEATRLEQAREQWSTARELLIAFQEELDWEIYVRYGLIAEEDAVLASPDCVPPVRGGERAFEIVLARRLARGEIETTWFQRHGFTPITEIPAHWPEGYQKVVRQRIEAIENDAFIRLIEQPEYKRRWGTPGWEKLQTKAIREWLLEQCEDPSLWYEENGEQRTPLPRTAEELLDLLRARDGVEKALELYASGREPIAALADLLGDEHVPYLSKLCFRDSGLKKLADWDNVWELQRREDVQKVQKEQLDIPVPPRFTSSDFLRVGYWRQRGKYNVPNERFISYPGASPSGDLLFGWAGWDHQERALVLINLIEERTSRDGWGAERVIPLLAGLAELLPWVRQWHGEVDPAFGMSPADAFTAYLEAKQIDHGIVDDDLRSWRPEPPKRGRPRKRPDVVGRQSR
ncbi:BREX-2 system adenine-specific DNA-methyltransferase PglX [Actinomadura miaoliensis]|uniref:site-specific DNA-methyltransferase (adenine-specific) n=1 Tax=Actinomadura miaoliensis TaxID=430685 RepID=A0ABP7W708_9ACTN